MQNDRALCLPPELLLEIGKLTRISDLVTLLLVNKWLNEFFSPLLYSSAILKTFHSAQMWLRTLSAPQNDLFGARDLACFVRNLNVSDVSSMFKTDRSLEDEMRTGITKVLPRLVHLRQLCFRTPGVLTSEVLVHFLHLSQGDICSLDVVLARDKKEAIPSRDTPHCDHVFHPLDNLTVLKITDLCSLTPACTQFFQRLLATRSDHIDTLSLANSDVDFVSSIIHTISCFPALTNLDLDVDAFLLPEFPHMAFPRVQTLALHGDERWLDFDRGDTGLVPFSAYPLLSQISCEEQFLYVFLPEEITPDQRRPIHNIQLRDTVYEVNGCWDYMGGAWSVVWNSLKSLRYSGTPVTHLSFDADGINLAQLASLSEYFTSLETLIISTADDLALEVRSISFTFCLLDNQG